ncbi:MAG: hypothetical protein WBP85_16900 [Terracidiphilus sp.]
MRAVYFIPRISLPVLAFALGLTPASASNIVVNGSFSAGSTGWTVSTPDPTQLGLGNLTTWTFGSSGSPVPLPGFPSPSYAQTGCAGDGCVDPNAPGGAFLSTLTQDLSTSPGSTYSLSFDFALITPDETYGAAGGPSEIQVWWGGTEIADLGSATTPDVSGFSNDTISGLSVSSGTTALEFIGREDDDFAYVSDVNVTAPNAPAVIPEGPTFLYVATALIALALLMFRRKLQQNRNSCT